MTSIVRRPRAEKDLVEIWAYIAQDDVRAAGLVDQIQAKLVLVADRPLIGRARPELAEALRSIAVGNYVLFYQPTPAGIDLVRIRSRYLDLDASDFVP
ncbi:type II toxin-antitoxin system RelE/ParE family toxin [Methylobacterium pseudosasicola]|uniref:Toxin ParE1/3/4 n=1 Tax=Methylobacterium pseudosasicola TaxID=582667 RepID=A0A1I4IK34_9HYPH|nr:type II toxin-antitoxin system RelE/ParE family toxin [Methylobacterium pseudosasicola]SFL54447.1 toxin ParE1/3/4 [Methylobacterium pseudosasicola]